MPFWNCPDPFVKALKSVGYNMVRLPKTDVRPLQLLYKNGDDLERLGAVTKLLTAGENIPVPTMTTDVRAANINVTRSGEMKIGLGVSLLGTIVGAMGGSNLGLELQYKNAKSATFECNDVLEDKVEVVDLDQYLGDADINPASVYVSKLLEADKLYITTAVIKSTKFIFDAKDSSGQGVQMDVPAIQGVVSGNVKVSTESSTSTKVTYEGKVPLIFGFQAVQIYYENGAYTAIKPASSVAMKDILSSPAEAGGAERFISEDTFVHLVDL
jgi:hypothetical protein